jgi:hypothetical protein
MNPEQKDQCFQTTHLVRNMDVVKATEYISPRFAYPFQTCLAFVNGKSAWVKHLRLPTVLSPELEMCDPWAIDVSTEALMERHYTRVCIQVCKYQYTLARQYVIGVMGSEICT